MLMYGSLNVHSSIASAAHGLALGVVDGHSQHNRNICSARDKCPVLRNRMEMFFLVVFVPTDDRQIDCFTPCACVG